MYKVAKEWHIYKLPLLVINDALRKILSGDYVTIVT